MGRAEIRAILSRGDLARKVRAVVIVSLAWTLLISAGSVRKTWAADAPSRSGNSGITVIYQKKRSFRIPFRIDEQGRARLKEVQLWVSEDSGFHWDPKSRTAPDLGKFTFRTNHDGEFWFATRTLTVDDEYSPPMNQTVEPSMKVIVDTVPPSVILEPDGRRGSMASVRWEVKDEHLDLKTLALEYRVEGAKEWRKVPIQQRNLLGAQSWDAGTADTVRVRATVADKAGNVGDAELVLPEGTAGAPDFAAADADAQAPPVEQISNSRSAIAEGPGFSPIQDDQPRGTRPGESTPRRGLTRRTRIPDAGAGGAATATPDWQRATPGIAFGGSRADAGPDANPFAQNTSAPGVANGPNDAFAAPAQGAAARPGSGAAQPQTRLVPSPRFKVQYAIDEVGPNGVALVELWVTRDGGRTWTRRGEDPDRVSPFEVDLGSEGTFGLSIVAQSASGLGDPPPAPGDPPQTWVEVDSTPPSVQLDAPQIGTGPYAGKVAINWRASDLHLPARSVTLLWRPDQPGAAWRPIIDAQENIGKFIWSVPPDLPAKIHVRVEAVDSVGHRGWAETTDAAPVIVDQSRPRSRIIGLDPNARAGSGPGAASLR